MDTRLSLAKIRWLGKLCKRGAGAIVVIGIVYLALLLYEYATTFSNATFAFSSGQLSRLSTFASFFSAFFPAALAMVFYAIVLYVAGSLILHFSQERDAHEEKKEAVEEEDYERVEITSLS